MRPWPRPDPLGSARDSRVGAGDFAVANFFPGGENGSIPVAIAREMLLRECTSLCGRM